MTNTQHHIALSYNLNNGFLEETQLNHLIDRIQDLKKHHPNAIITIATQEHQNTCFGWWGTSIEQKILTELNKKGEEYGQIPKKHSQSSQSNWFWAPTKGHSLLSWQGAFCLAPKRIIHSKGLAADFTTVKDRHNRSKGGVILTVSSTPEEKESRDLFQTWTGHLSSDSAYLRNRELLHFSTPEGNTYLPLEAFKKRAQTYSTRAFLGDGNMRTLTIEEYTADQEANKTEGQHEVLTSNHSSAKKERAMIEHIRGLPNDYSLPKQEGTDATGSYLSKNPEQVRRRSSKNHLNDPPKNHLNDSPRSSGETTIETNSTEDDASSTASNDSSSMTTVIEKNRGPLDVFLPFGNNIKGLQQVYHPKEYAQKKDHLALEATYELPTQEKNDYKLMVDMINEEMRLAGLVLTLNSSINTQASEKQLCVLFHLFKSIRHIQAHEKLLELYLDDRPQSTTPNHPNDNKLSDKLIEDVQNTLQKTDQKKSIQAITKQQNTIIKNHWKENNSHWFLSTRAMFWYAVMWLNPTKTSPKKAVVRHELQSLTIQAVDGKDQNTLIPSTLFASSKDQEPPTQAAPISNTNQILEQQATCSIM